MNVRQTIFRSVMSIVMILTLVLAYEVTNSSQFIPTDFNEETGMFDGYIVVKKGPVNMYYHLTVHVDYIRTYGSNRLWIHDRDFEDNENIDVYQSYYEERDK
jgi:hypothetical protein